MDKESKNTIFRPVVNINLVQRADAFGGDYVGNKVNIKDSEIGQLVVPTAEGQQREEITERNAARNIGESDQGEIMSVGMELLDGMTQLPHDISKRTADETRDRDAFFLEEKCIYMFRLRKFIEMKALLQKLLPLQFSFWHRLKFRLMMTDCIIYTGTRLEAIREIDKVVQMVTQSTGRPRAIDIIHLAEVYAQQNFILRALVLYQCVCKLYEIDSPAKDAMIGMTVSFDGMSSIVEKLRRTADSTRNKSSEISVLFMHDQLRYLRGIEDVESSFKVCHEIICMHCIGRVLLAAEEITKANGIFKECIEKMHTEYGSGASKHSIYGSLLNGCGVACVRETKLKQAENYYLQARKAWEEAEDFKNIEIKEEYLGKLKRSLNKIRKFM